MNVLTILIDSLNRHALSAYGETQVCTPNLAAFADRALIFDNHFIACAPCMPARRNLLTGRREFLWRGWGTTEPYDTHLARAAAAQGAVTAMVTDHYHYWEQPGNGYMQGFDGVEMVRGHENDFWHTQPVAHLPDWARAINRWRPGWGTRYFRNVADFRTEEEFFPARVMTSAADWLERNHSHDKWLLWVEEFDVHEPFHVPEPYRSMYTDDLDPGFTCWPPYQNGFFGRNEEYFEQLSERELNFIRAQYAGKVTMVDKWLGRIFDKLDERRLWDETMVIVTTDHGHELGEKGRFGKPYPHYDLHARIPLLVWHPAMRSCQLCGTRESGITQAVDINATIADAMGADVSLTSPHGRSFLPRLEGKSWRGRDCALYGTFGAGAVLTTGDFTYASAIEPERPLYRYSTYLSRPTKEATAGSFMKGVDSPVWKEPVAGAAQHPEMFFDRRNDPAQNENIAASHANAAGQMRAHLKRELETLHAPEEQYARLALA